MAEYPFQLLQRAVREGRSATDALRAYRAAGGSIRTQTWYSMYGQARLEFESLSRELDAPLHLRPGADEILPRTTVSAQGYMQNVTLLLREKGTGERPGERPTIVARPFSLRGDGVLTRQQAIETAIETLASFNDQYGFVVEGGIYTGTYELTPGL